jgi:hypothetical protein
MSGEDRYDLRAYPLFRSMIDGLNGKAKPKKCFVMAPWNDQFGEARQHAETLWKYVIQPALLDTDYAARRAEETTPSAAGDQASIDALLDDDLVIAVLSFRNPRVFYETALAQAAARPLILMIEDGQDLPFDPRGAKVLTYSLDTDSVVHAINVTKLQAAIREIEEAGAPTAHGFRAGTAALNGGNGGATVFERSPQFSYDQRLNMMREAKTRIDIMGIANLAIAMHPDTLEVVRSRSGDEVEIRVLQCAASNPGLVSLLGNRNGQGIDAIRHEIEKAAEAWRRIIDLPELEISIAVRRTQTSLPSANTLITDQAAVTTPYLRSRIPAESPTLYALAGSAYYRVISQEFDMLWSEAATLFRAEPRLVLHAPAGDAADPPRPPLIQPAPTTNARGFALIRGIG